MPPNPPTSVEDLPLVLTLPDLALLLRESEDAARRRTDVPGELPRSGRTAPRRWLRDVVLEWIEQQARAAS